MLGFSPLSFAPLSATDSAPIVPDDTVTNIRKYRRYSNGSPPHPSQIKGVIKRREGVPDEVVILETVTNVGRYRRSVRGSPPHPSQLQGRVYRSEVVALDYIFVRLPPPRRVVQIHPHPSWLGGKVHRREGRTPDWIEFFQTYTQGFRVADTAFDIYELFVGENQSPDFEGAPRATSATLPFQWTPTPPSSGTKTLHIVVRRRNRYTLQSFNVYETIRVINTGSVEQLGPVSAPRDVVVYDDVSGYVKVIAKYLPSEDQNPADTWEVYIKIGSDPVIGVDPAVNIGTLATMITYANESVLQATIGPYTPGTVAHVRVVAKRASDSERGLAAIIEHTLAVVPALGDGQMFGGTYYEQR